MPSAALQTAPLGGRPRSVTLLFAKSVYKDFVSYVPIFLFLGFI